MIFCKGTLAITNDETGSYRGGLACALSVSDPHTGIFKRNVVTLIKVWYDGSVTVCEDHPCDVYWSGVEEVFELP